MPMLRMLRMQAAYVYFVRTIAMKFRVWTAGHRCRVEENQSAVVFNREFRETGRLMCWEGFCVCVRCLMSVFLFVIERGRYKTESVSVVGFKSWKF